MRIPCPVPLDLTDVPGGALGLIRVSGPDALSFLQGQLTQDVLGCPIGQARWAGYCSAKGRLLATARMWRDDAQIGLIVSAELAAPIAKRLSMFVLRAKVRVEDASASHRILGVLGDAALAQARQWLLGGEPGASVSGAGADDTQGHVSGALPDDAVLSAPRGVLVSLPRMPGDADPAALGDGLDRALLVIPVAHMDACPTDWRVPPSAQAIQDWALAEVLSAIPRVGAATSECFVPQMVNFESVGGVSFTKGCYPGQEVVARSQYLGKVKRRMALGRGVGAAPAPGSDVLAQGQAEPCGQVVLSAPWFRAHSAPVGGAETADEFAVLFECRTDLVGTVSLRTALGGLADQGSDIRILPLPYPLQTQD